MNLARLITTTLAAAISTLALAQPTHVSLTDPDERLRCGAGTAYYPVATLKAGTVLEVRDQTENGWFAVAYPKTLDALVPARKARVEQDGVVVLTEPDRLLALHATLGPSASWAKLLDEALPEGTRLFASDDKPGARETERWLRVRAPGDALAFLRVNAVRPATQDEIQAFLNPKPKTEKQNTPKAEQAVAEQPEAEQPTAELPHDAQEYAEQSEPEGASTPAIQQPALDPVIEPETAPEPQDDPADEPEIVAITPVNPFQADPVEPAPDERPNPFTEPDSSGDSANDAPDTGVAETVETGPANPFAPVATQQEQQEDAQASESPAEAPQPEPNQSQPAQSEPTQSEPANETPAEAPAEPSAQQPAQQEPVQQESTQQESTQQESTQQEPTQPVEQPVTQPEPEPLEPEVLDELYRGVSRQPTIEAEFGQLIEQYDRTLAQGGLDEETADVLARQLAILNIRRDVQREMLANAEAQRKARRLRASAEIETRRLEESRPYDVRGRLRRSVVYSGGALPLMYRVVSVEQGEEGLTLAYVRDREDLGLQRLDGRIVGLRGRFEPFAGGAVRAFDATGVKPLPEPVGTGG